MALRRLLLVCALGLCALPASAQAQVGVDMSCFAPAGNPEPGSQEWYDRDLHNQYCASLRPRDQLAHRAFGFGNLTQGATLYTAQVADELSHPTDPNGGLTTRIVGAKAADPYRSVERWEAAGRGRVAAVSFPALNGSNLRGHVFAPPPSVPRPPGGFPGVVITDGSVQGYEELYFWAAEDLAEAGYVTMTYDVQGQGDSSLFGEDCPGECSGVPYQQDYNFFQGAEDSLGFFLSGGNPFGDLLDADRVGLAGHSLGASAISHVGQCDDRVKTIVAWDNLRKIENCDGITIPEQHRTQGLINVPALALTNDYAFNTTTARTRPDAEAKTAGYKQVAEAGLDAQIVALRNATHLAYTYIPLVFQSNQLGERMASYFTKAWFDWKLKGDRSGYDRLTAAQFDDSVDKTSIGTGTYDPLKADPTDPYSGNVPYMIGGIPIAEAVSFYYRSAYSLRDPRTRRVRVCEDVRAGCPAAGPPAPDAGPAAPGAAAPVTVGRSEPVRYSVRVRPRRLRAALRRGLLARATCSAPCTLSIALKARGRTVARGRVPRAFSGTRTVTLRFTRAAARRLRGARRLDLAVVVTARDASGATSRSRGRIELRR